MSGRVVHCRREPFDVYIGRPSKWGNPFSHIRGKETLAKHLVKDRDEAIARYRQWILTQPQLLKDLGELKGKVLGCWCSPQRCHGEILLRLADGEDPAYQP